ncbi:MAG: LamG domain-containing protein [Candidatus Obscuribacterales bacterium]|nr:LamG domain-containing protein [Steroidobacteraceae bacterium]
MTRTYTFHTLHKLLLTVVILGTIAGCGGGAPTTENAVTNQTTTGSTNAYPANAPTPATADVQAFKLNVWDNLQGADRCGGCHKDSQTPRFVRADDINIAYQEANTVVDLANPSLSRMVARVRAGHHCWSGDNNACGDTLVRWITAWADVTQGGGGRQIQLTAPTLADPGASRVLPTDPNAGGASSFANTVWPVLTTNCARCHRAESTTPQQPYFASPDINVAYEQARTKMNLDSPALSRLVVRLRSEFHNCWRVPVGGSVDCTASSNIMEQAITTFAAGIPSTQIPAAWVTSKALGMYGGTVASGGNRYDNNVIALYEFKTGNGSTVYDTSGVNPQLDLTLFNTTSGGYQWVGGWGVQFTGGKAQGLTNTSRKLRDLITNTNEYSVEAWAAPANVTQEDTRIVSYSGGLLSRNFTLGQSLYNYDFFARTSGTNSNGAPALSTLDAQRALQATLQHVVVTFDPVNGRRIYVNGVFTGRSDAAGNSLGTWDETLAFVLGNEASGNRPWFGTLKLVAVHNRALTLTQIQQNFAAGVGEKYLLLFSVSHLVNVPQSYIMFEVSQYDSYSYLFNQPKFISLDPAALPGNLTLRGMRIGINGSEPLTGQAYRALNTVVTDAMYTPIAGASLSNVGTIIALERGPIDDQFFLTFEQLGASTNVRTEPTPLTPQPPPDVPRPSDVGVRTFDGINESFSQITGVNKNVVRSNYVTVKQQLPTVENFPGFLAAHQIAIAQMAIAYCSAMIDDATLRSNFFGSVNMSSPLTSQADRDAVINPIVSKVMGLNLSSQPDPVAIHNELNLLISNNAAGRAPGLCVSSACGASRTPVVMKAACAAGLGSGAALVQ